MALSIDSTIGEILADDKGKAILDKHIAGFSTNPQIEPAKGMSLKAVAPMSQGAITDAMLAEGCIAHSTAGWSEVHGIQSTAERLSTCIRGPSVPTHQRTRTASYSWRARHAECIAM